MFLQRCLLEGSGQSGYSWSTGRSFDTPLIEHNIPKINGENAPEDELKELGKGSKS